MYVRLEVIRAGCNVQRESVQIKANVYYTSRLRGNPLHDESLPAAKRNPFPKRISLTAAEKKV